MFFGQYNVRDGTWTTATVRGGLRVCFGDSSRKVPSADSGPFVKVQKNRTHGEIAGKSNNNRAKSSNGHWQCKQSSNEFARVVDM
jgi:hypothetical protein